MLAVGSPHRTADAIRPVFMASGKSASLEVARYVRHVVEQEIAKGATASEIAARMGISKGQLSLVRTSDRGVGFTTLDGVARLRSTTTEALLTEAARWAKANPGAVAPAASPDRYPARVKAIARAREDGRSDRAIQAVATFQGHDADALTVEAWSALIMNFEAAFAAGKLGTKPKKP